MSSRVKIDAVAPEFELDDYRGQPIHLSDYRGLKHVVLVLNRGFA